MVHQISDDEIEPLQDLTAALTLQNRATERKRRKNVLRQQKLDALPNLGKLPTEILLECLRHLEPRDVFQFSFVNARFDHVVRRNANMIGSAIIDSHYGILAQCFSLPKRLIDIEPSIQALLNAPIRQAQLSMHKRPYQHIHAPNATELCTCLTCILLWNNLALALDFAHWQDNLDSGEPIPIIPRGQTPEWNTELVNRNARIARKAVGNTLWYARILQLHLGSTIRAIKRHARNKGNQRIHVDMTDEEAEAGFDSFLSKHGPPSIEFPFQRDEYYMLEAYLPNRWWRKAEGRWVYSIPGQHERDLEVLQAWSGRDQLALLSRATESIDHENWMSDAMDFKTFMAPQKPCASPPSASSSRRLSKYYAAVV